MAKQTLRDIKVTGKKVLVRVDFNVPQTPDGDVADDRRIKSALPTLKAVLESGGSLILVSHLGRPTGDPATDAPFRLDKVATRLQELIGLPVKKVNDTVGPDAQAACANLRPGGIVVLDNALWGGRVADLSYQDEDTTAIREVCERLRSDEQLVPLLLPLGDGLLAGVKRGE